jgi:hypothetical protein
MRSRVRIFVAAMVLGTSVTVASAQAGPYDGSSYWDRVERQQECAWKAQGSLYQPTFAYGPEESCNYGPSATQYYAAPHRFPYQYSYGPPYYYR